MMIYLLDTNTCIQYLTGRSENVINKFKTTHSENICLCDVVKGELYSVTHHLMLYNWKHNLPSPLETSNNYNLCILPINY